MTEQEPIKTEKITGKLSDEDVNIEGMVFEKPIFPGGDPLVHTCVRIFKGVDQIGSAFYADPMGDEELKDKLNEVAENVKPYLYPAYK